MDINSLINEYFEEAGYNEADSYDKCCAQEEIASAIKTTFNVVISQSASWLLENASKYNTQDKKDLLMMLNDYGNYIQSK